MANQNVFFDKKNEAGLGCVASLAYWLGPFDVESVHRNLSPRGLPLADVGVADWVCIFDARANLLIQYFLQVWFCTTELRRTLALQDRRADSEKLSAVDSIANFRTCVSQCENAFEKNRRLRRATDFFAPSA